MLSKNEIKWVKSLQKKNIRDTENQFSAEGSRLVLDLIRDIPENLNKLYATTDWIVRNEAKIQHLSDKIKELETDELAKIASLSSTRQVMAVFQMPTNIPHSNDYCLFLENVTDPGNYGTIVRTADWFGISKIYFTEGCVDRYNNKAIQASMSSICRVDQTKISLPDLKKQFPEHAVIAASLSGHEIKNQTKPNKGILCLGNEANGLSQDCLELCTQTILIPGNSLGAESLNVAIAGGILMNWWLT